MKRIADNIFFYAFYAWAFYPLFRVAVLLLIVMPWVLLLWPTP